MKKIISLIMLLGFTVIAFPQQINPRKKQLSSKDYLSKSEDQLVFGCILLGAGTGLIFVGANQNGPSLDNILGGAVTKAIGVVAIGGSIPLFIGAIHNHKKGKAISANIKFENYWSVQQLKFAYHSFPAVSVNIHLTQ
jgi:hypothetical protein